MLEALILDKVLNLEYRKYKSYEVVRNRHVRIAVDRHDLSTSVNIDGNDVYGCILSGIMHSNTNIIVILPIGKPPIRVNVETGWWEVIRSGPVYRHSIMEWYE